MLYDPKWEVQTKPISKPRFVRWLEKQPSNKAYDYTSPLNCPYAQYLRSYGIFAAVNPIFWIGLWLGVVPVGGIVPRAINNILNDGGWKETFGDALGRARKALCPQDTRP